MGTSNVAEAAKDYINRHGFSVIPLWGIDADGNCLCSAKGTCSSAGKHPMKNRESMISDELEAELFFSRYPDANIGIATGKESGIIVIDEDSYKEKKGELGFDLPKTLRQSTGGGGKHHIFRYPKDVVIKNSASSIADAIDVRGDGGFVVAAPSKHKSGKQYEINCEHPEISDAPEQLVQHILKNQRTSLDATVKEYGVEAVEKFGLTALTHEIKERERSEMAFDVEIPEGKRNETLFKQACKLQGDGLGDGAVRAAIHEQNAEFCKPMLEYEEVENLVESALKYDKGDRIWEASLENADENFDERNLFLSWGEIQKTEYETPEYVIYGLPRGSVGMVVGITNFGKSSFLRNLAVSLATGSSYLDMVDEGEPKRVMLLDYETPFAFYKADIEKMVSILPEEKKKLVEMNLRSYVAKEMNTPFMDLSEQNHFEYLAKAAAELQPDLIIVDTVSAGFTIKSENDNGEVTNKVMKPLQQLSTASNAVVLFAHHIGKAGSEEGSAANNYRARGASAFEGMSLAVIQLDKKKTPSGERVSTLNFSKVKDEQPEELVLKLNPDTRWFEIDETSIAYNSWDENYMRMIELIDKPMTAKEIRDKAKLTKATCDRYLRRAVHEKKLHKLQRGVYAPDTIPFGD